MGTALPPIDISQTLEGGWKWVRGLNSKAGKSRRRMKKAGSGNWAGERAGPDPYFQSLRTALELAPQERELAKREELGVTSATSASRGWGWGKPRKGR